MVLNNLSRFGAIKNKQNIREYDIISNVNKEKFFKEFETNKNIYYNCDPCSI